jgi:hypothetical protein
MCYSLYSDFDEKGQLKSVAKDLPTETDAQDPPTETKSFTLIGESESCNKGVSASSFGYGLSLEECAAACLNLGNCSYFIFDPSDGECAEEHTDNGCVGDRFQRSYYSLYEVD